MSAGKRRSGKGGEAVEPWMEAEAVDEGWETCLRNLPVCADCGERITEEMCLPIEEERTAGVLCPRCVRARMVPVETYCL